MDDIITFTWKSGDHTNCHTLNWDVRYTSREGVGVWRVGNYAVKIFATRHHLESLQDDYRRANIAGLPVGSPSFRQGTVKHGTATATQGFILVVQWSEGSRFLHTASSFRVALSRQGFTRDRSSMEYQRLQGGALSARAVGLKDPQGFINATSGLYEPLRFMDVHTSWNRRTGKYGHSEVAEEIVDIVNSWGDP